MHGASPYMGIHTNSDGSYSARKCHVELFFRDSYTTVVDRTSWYLRSIEGEAGVRGKASESTSPASHERFWGAISLCSWSGLSQRSGPYEFYGPCES